MTSLAYITAAPWSAPVSMQSTPREVDGLRPSRQKYIGKHVKPVVGGKVLLTQKVMSIKVPVSVPLLALRVAMRTRCKNEI